MQPFPKQIVLHLHFKKIADVRSANSLSTSSLYSACSTVVSATRIQAFHQRFPSTVHSRCLAAVQIPNKGCAWQPLENEWVWQLSHEMYCKY